MTSEAYSKICVLGCALACGVDLASVLSPCRERRAVTARIAAAVMLREQGMRLAQIGRRLGFRHHASVLHYLRRAAEIPETIEKIMAWSRDFVARIERACERAKRRQDSGVPLHPANPRPRSTHANGNGSRHCAERGCVMPAAVNGYCRYHWAMRTDPKPFQKQEVLSGGRVNYGSGWVAITRAIG